MPIINRVADFADEVTGWRRDIHAHPELLYDVHRTAGLVAERLRAFGCDEVVTGIGRTGVVGVVRGARGSSGRTIGLRADMDALPIEEETNAQYRSTVPGKMHACGHDGHTAMLLGAAKYLAETRNFDGTAVFIFQPAEEGGAGAAAMLQEGLMDRFGVDEVYGVHNWPGIPVGHFAVKPGPLMAAADKFTITVTGRGGHAAHPHQCADPLVAGAQMVGAMQSIVARNVDPLDAAVLSICSFRSGDTYNVIPQVATILGTVRTLKPEVQAIVQGRIHAVAESVATAMGVTAEVDYVRGYPVTFNHAEQTEFMARIAGEVSGVNTDIVPQMGAEDFSYMLLERPGAYMFIGNGDSALCHHPAYDFDDGAIPYGISLFAKIVEERTAA